MNHGFVDGMSFIHGGVGIVMGLFRLSLPITLIVAVAWEVAEHLLKIHHPQMFVFPSQDSLANAVTDVVFAAIGWALAGPIRRAGRRRAPSS